MKALEVIIVTLILAKQTIKPITQTMVNILTIITIGTNKKEVIKMIKRILIVITVIIVISLFGMIENTYTREVTVTEVQDQEVTVVDVSGNEFCFYGTDYTVDQEITVVMTTNNTDSITDDKIIDVR